MFDVFDFGFLDSDFEDLRLVDVSFLDSASDSDDSSLEEAIEDSVSDSELELARRLRCTHVFVFSLAMFLPEMVYDDSKSASLIK